MDTRKLKSDQRSQSSDPRLNPAGHIQQLQTDGHGVSDLPQPGCQSIQLDAHSGLADVANPGSGRPRDIVSDFQVQLRVVANPHPKIAAAVAADRRRENLHSDLPALRTSKDPAKQDPAGLFRPEMKTADLAVGNDADCFISLVERKTVAGNVAKPQIEKLPRLGQHQQCFRSGIAAFLNRLLANVESR